MFLVCNSVCVRACVRKKEVYCASNCHVHKHVYSRFGISFAVLASLSISSTAFTFLSFADSLQSKLVMALVSLFIVAAFFLQRLEADGNHRERAYGSHRVANCLFDKRARPCGHSACNRPSMREDISGPAELQ